MALKHVLIALTCAVAFPVAALAQSPVQKMAANADCCATDDGSAAAAAVLLPPMALIQADTCCQTGQTPAVAVDHSTHLPVPPTESGRATHGMGQMACCDHGATQSGAQAAACCQDMKDGCGMGCCGGVPPKR